MLPIGKRAEFRSLLLRLVEMRDKPGIAVAVIHKDRLVYSRGFGYRDLEQRLPVTPETVFPVGSCTKAITAALPGSLSPKNYTGCPRTQLFTGM